MSDYRRYFVPGGTYFFTLVTYDRRPILTTEMHRKFLRQAILKIFGRYPFKIIATVLLPDHWHVVMSLPPGDSRYSMRLQRIKAEFTYSFTQAGGIDTLVTASQAKRGERGIWQPRFWEHTIVDEEDLGRCCDYPPIRRGGAVWPGLGRQNA